MSDVQTNPVSGDGLRLFYLQHHPKQKRRDFIDDYVHEGCEVLDEVEAENWRAARKQIFGDSDL